VIGPAFIHRWENKSHTGPLFHKVACTRYDIP
jgi:hypothetical protein